MASFFKRSRKPRKQLLLFQAQNRSCSLLSKSHLGKLRHEASEASVSIWNRSKALDRRRTSLLGPGVPRWHRETQRKTGRVLSDRRAGRASEDLQKQRSFAAKGWQIGFKVWADSD